MSVVKHPNFSNEIQEKVETFHHNKNATPSKLGEIIQAPLPARPPLLEPEKEEVVVFTGDDSEIMQKLFTTKVQCQRF